MEISLDDLLPALGTETNLAHLDILNPTPAPQNTQEKFLHFCLHAAEDAFLPVSSITEVLKTPMTEVLPVPQMPQYVLGLYNRRGEMLWLIDLGHFVGYSLGFQPGNSFVTGMAIVLETDGQQLGLVVPKIYDIEWHDPRQLQPPSIQLFSAKLLPFVQGYLSESGATVLDPWAIAKALA
jgi:positive phototaxis protein PixI